MSCPMFAASTPANPQVCSVSETFAATKAARNRPASTGRRRARTSFVSWVILVVAAVEARLAGSRRMAWRAEDQALRLGLELAKHFIQLPRRTQQAFAERVEIRHGLTVQLVAQLP